MQVTYTQEEINTSIQLFDLAVKAGGLNVANAALTLTKKLQDSLKVSSTSIAPEVVSEE